MRTALRLAPLLVVASACSSLDQFDLDLSAEATIPGTIGQVVSRGFPSGGEIGQKIENQGVDPADVKSAKLSKGAIRVVAPETGHLTYVKSLELFVEAEGLERKRIASASAEAFADRPTSVALTLDDVELQPYVTAPATEIVPELELASRPSQSLTVAIDLMLFVDLTLVD